MTVWQYYSFNGNLRKKILSFRTHSSELGTVFLIEVNSIHLTLAPNPQARQLPDVNPPSLLNLAIT